MPRVNIINPSGSENIRIDGSSGDIDLGLAQGVDGDITLRDNAGIERIRLNGQDSALWLNHLSGQTSIIFDGRSGDARLGFGTLATPGVDGDLYLRNRYGVQVLHFNGDAARINCGAVGVAGSIRLVNVQGVTTLELLGSTGDIILSNADCAEEFEIDPNESVEPGSVMVLDESEKLKLCTEPYDKKVVGIVSGAGSYRPGIVLDRKITDTRRLPIALMGKVFCKVINVGSPIEVGDMLVTSDKPGFAMKGNDPFKAFGAVIGKALRPMKESEGIIPVLVTLQ